MIITGRLVYWHLILTAYILLFPLLHQFIGKTSIKNIELRTYAMYVLAFFGLELTYLVFGLGFSEFQTFMLIGMYFFHYQVYRSLSMVATSLPMGVSSLDTNVLDKLKKSLHGASLDIDAHHFQLTNVYRMRFVVNGFSRDDQSFFQINAFPTNLITVVHFLAIAISTYSLNKPDLNNPSVVLPFLGNMVLDVVNISILSIVASLILLVIERNATFAYALELPLLYGKILKKESLEKVWQQPSSQPEPDVSELEKARERAREILNARQSDILYRKRDELKNKVDDIFATEENKIGLDAETLEKVRLYNAVKRILISTPPWSTATLQDIAELAGGNEEEVELIIANLVEKAEVPGIYDIWQQQYSGTPYSQWFANEIYKKIRKDQTSIRKLTVYPDGSADISLEEKSENQEETVLQIKNDS